MRRLILSYTSERWKRGDWSNITRDTIRARLYDFTQHTELPAKRITRRQVERWLELPSSVAYKRHKLSALRGFCKWCCQRGHMDRDPTRDVVAPRQPRYAPRYVQSDDVAKVLTACGDRRARLMVLLMVQEGLRRGEVAALEIGDWDERRQSISVRGKGGRGGITRVLPLSDQTASALVAYLCEHPAGSGALVRAYTHGGALTPACVSKIVTAAMELSGVKVCGGDGKTPHALRHTAAQDTLEAGADIRQVQAMLGHSSVQMTEWYLRGEVEGLRGAMGGRSYG